MKQILYAKFLFIEALNAIPFMLKEKIKYIVTDTAHVSFQFTLLLQNFCVYCYLLQYDYLGLER
jgi:hypothetical protein